MNSYDLKILRQILFWTYEYEMWSSSLSTRQVFPNLLSIIGITAETAKKKEEQR